MTNQAGPVVRRIKWSFMDHLSSNRSAGPDQASRKHTAHTFRAFSVHGLDVPTDVSVVTFDGTELATCLRLPVVSAELPSEATGYRAIEELLALGPPSPDVRWVPLPLQAGRSVRKALLTAS